MVVHHDESLYHGGFLLSSRRTNRAEFRWKNARPRKLGIARRGNGGETRAYCPNESVEDGWCLGEIAHAVCSERAGVSACVDQ